MPDTKVNANSCFKEAVCIDAGRIYDSCSDKDCLEDLQVHFDSCTANIIDSAVNVKCRKIELINVYLDVESVPFNKGFYAVDITFFFAVKLGVYTNPCTSTTEITGIATYSKKVILYGSEGNVQVFTSIDPRDCTHKTVSNMPKASVHVVDPICLNCRLTECPEYLMDQCITFPECICRKFNGEFGSHKPSKVVLITIGLFTIVQLERSVQMMIPAYDFCMPDKECVSTTDDPCELFKRIKFPVNEFFPPNLSDVTCEE